VTDYVGPSFGGVFDVEHRGKGFIFFSGKGSPVAIEAVGEVSLVVSPAVAVLSFNQGEVFVLAPEPICVAGFEDISLEGYYGSRPIMGKLIQGRFGTPHFSIK